MKDFPKGSVLKVTLHTCTRRSWLDIRFSCDFVTYFYHCQESVTIGICRIILTLAPVNNWQKKRDFLPVSSTIQIKISPKMTKLGSRNTSYTSSSLREQPHVFVARQRMKKTVFIGWQRSFCQTNFRKAVDVLHHAALLCCTKISFVALCRVNFRGIKFSWFFSTCF